MQLGDQLDVSHHPIPSILDMKVISK